MLEMLPGQLILRAGRLIPFSAHRAPSARPRGAVHLPPTFRHSSSTPSLRPPRPRSPATFPPPDPPPPPPPPPEITFEPLPRSLPPSRGLLLLSIPIPPTAWPPRLEFASPLLSLASQRLKPHGISVNMVYDGSGASTSFVGKVDEERYPARLLFPDGTCWEEPQFGKDTLDDARFLADGAGYTPPSSGLRDGVEKGGGRREVLVCTHGSRDCRCSDRGGPLVLALREEAARRGVEGQVKVSEIAHVGGHKYAANAILLPSLDMLSNLTSEHAPAIISHLLDGGKSSSGMWAHWRGRYGLSEEAQQKVWEKVNPARQIRELPAEEGAVVRVRFRTFEGEIKEVEGREGESLLAIAKRGGVESMEGVCGGHLECATCHCYLPAGAPQPDPSDEELDMLGYAISYREGESRLGCQIKVQGEVKAWLDGGGVVGLPRF